MKRRPQEGQKPATVTRLYVVVPYRDPVMVGTEVRWNEASFALRGDRFVRRGTKHWEADGTFSLGSLDFS